MMSKSKHMTLGLVLMVSFFVVLFLMFMPLFDGKSYFAYEDMMYNTISKGSTMEYIPKQLQAADTFVGQRYDLELEFRSGEIEEHMGYHAEGEEVAANAAKVLSGPADSVQVSGNTLQVSMDLGKVMTTAMQDSWDMFNGDPQEIASRYGMDSKMVMFTWWKVFREMHRQLLLANEAKAAKAVDNALKRGIELAYNYEGIPAVKAGDNVFKLTFSLVFYVVYTLWWGIAILHVFEGLGMAMKKGKKAEV